MLLYITLDRVYTRDETYTVFIDYTAKPHDLEAANEYITYDNQGLYFINADGSNKNKPRQIWTQGETEANSCWFPTIDQPNERMTQELYLTVKQHLVTLSNGQLIKSTNNTADSTRTDYWRQDLPHAPYLAALTVSEYAVVQDTWQGKQVDYYVEPAYAPYARNIFGNTPEMLGFFSEVLGYPYPWDKYSQAVVRDFVAGAMENTGAVLLTEDLHMTDVELLDGNYEDIIAHELFHHWFGDLITCESWSNLALNEAFATYGEYLWFDHKYGRDMADEHITNDLKAYLAEAQTKQVPIIRFYYDDREDMFDRHSYQKGGRVLHMLRSYVGDEAFFTAIKQYVKQYAYKTVEIHDLRLIFESIIGEDLNWFFNQWFLNQGHPDLVIDYAYDDTTKQVTVVVNQVQTNDKVFYLPTTIDIYYADGSRKRESIVVDKKESTFIFDVKTAPKLVNFDGDKVLLCSKNENKTVDYYKYQYEYAPLFLDRYEAILALAQQQNNDDLTVSETLYKAFDDAFWGLRAKAIESISFTNDATLNQKIIDKMSVLATTDDYSLVRANAFTKLVLLNNEEVIPVLQKGLSDPSIQVNYQALDGIYTLSPQKAMEQAKIFETTTNGSLANLVGRIYAEAGGAEEQVYFENRLKKAQLYDKHTLIDYYGKYLHHNGIAILQKGLTSLKEIAEKDTNWWIRLKATETINDLRTFYTNRVAQIEKNDTTDPLAQDLAAITVQIERMNTMLETIKANETNERLLEHYKNM